MRIVVAALECITLLSKLLSCMYVFVFFVIVECIMYTCFDDEMYCNRWQFRPNLNCNAIVVVNNGQSPNTLAEQLVVTQQAVAIRLRAIWQCPECQCSHTKLNLLSDNALSPTARLSQNSYWGHQQTRK